MSLLLAAGGGVAQAPFNNSGQLSGAPAARQRGFVDVIPNLLMATLATAALVPRGPLLNAYQGKAAVSAEQQVNRLPLVAGGVVAAPIVPVDWPATPAAKARTWFGQEANPVILLPVVAASPFANADPGRVQPKGQVWADQFLNYATLGIPAPPALPGVGRLSDSAPQVRRVGLDAYPNLTVTTLVPLAPAPFTPVDTARLQPRTPVWADQFLNYQVLGIPLAGNPQVRALFDSAPQLRRVGLDVYPNLQTTTLAPIAAVPFTPIDVSRLQPKAQVRAEQFLNYSTLGIAPVPTPKVGALYDSAPQIRRIALELFPNLSTSTLAPPPPPFEVQRLRFDVRPEVVRFDVAAGLQWFAIGRERSAFMAGMESGKFVLGRALLGEVRRNDG